MKQSFATRIVSCWFIAFAVVPPTVGQQPVLPGGEWNKLFAWHSIGPTDMGGCIPGIAVVDAAPTNYYVATASRRLLKTVNNGSTFDHQFDKEATVFLGAIAVAPNKREHVWVGIRDVQDAAVFEIAHHRDELTPMKRVFIDAQDLRRHGRPPRQAVFGTRASRHTATQDRLELAGFKETSASG